MCGDYQAGSVSSICVPFFICNTQNVGSYDRQQDRSLLERWRLMFGDETGTLDG